MLSKIDTVTLELYKCGALGSHYRYAVDVLLDSVIQGRDDVSSSFYCNSLSLKYITPRTQTVTDLHFESGSVKIQNRCN